jgi:PAS domain S-box-containing protein
MSRRLLVDRRPMTDLFAEEAKSQHGGGQGTLEARDDLSGAILRSLSANVAVLDRHGVIIAVNEPWQRRWRSPGPEEAELITAGVDYLEMLAASARGGGHRAAEARAGVEAVCAGLQDTFELEYRCDVSGDERWFLMTVSPLRHQDGGAVVVHADITARKRAEIALRESEDRFRQLTDSLPVGVWMSGADAACTYCNKTWLDLTGQPLERQLGEGWLDSVHPADRERCRYVYQRAFEAREPFSVEYRLRRHDGEYRWLLGHGVPRYDERGTFLGYIGGVTDLTEYRRAQEALRDLSGRLIGAQEQERARIGRELHDNVSQRLALLAMRIDVLRNSVPPRADDLAAGLARLGTATSEISREVHGLSHRLHSIKLEALGLVSALRAHCRELSQHGIHVHFAAANVQNRLPGDIALCLYRVAQEALANVVQHSGVTDARVELSGGPNGVVLRVSDSGKGFDPTGPSDGLGLTSMRERVRLLGGSITVNSKPNRGTVVEVQVAIPVATPSATRPPSVA